MCYLIYRNVSRLFNNFFHLDIDIITGVVKDEGSLAASSFEKMKGNIYDQVKNEMISTTKQNYHEIDPQKVVDFYLKYVDKNNTDAIRHAYLDYHGDIYEKCPSYQFAKQFALNNPKRKTYFYKQTFQSARSSLCDQKKIGICHGADVEFVFGIYLAYPKSDQIDKNFSYETMTLWTNFAKNGYKFKD